ncbi:hypothetical protein G3570_01480 [Balneolaceae bacterium YR4-1]|uniref:Bacterial transcriptional activator domain-containing protein n=1 Tax=Halalkalibaculum roseum TaxID=2709311 RepID=A0A6M1SJU3_9BACT|nr:BTAD domain-containing putative transcriptional regulator [Halalkalibaculum roseum]NGP75289.1 hypothetical protein [Halalkalibaculum roseum]
MGEPGRLHIELLGGFKLQYNGKLITTIDTPRLHQLLAYLLLHRDIQLSRQYVAFKFWPQSTEKQALTNLRNLLYQLKNKLPEASRFLIINTKTIQWNTNTNYTSDVCKVEDAVFQANSTDDIELKVNYLKEGIEAYKGPLLPECYKEWIDKHRQQFQQLYKESLEELINLLESSGNLKEAIQYTKKLIQHDSLNESAWRKLMKLHAQNNNRAEALQAYYNCRDSLQEEFDIDPAPKTEQVHQELLDSCKSRKIAPLVDERTSQAAMTSASRDNHRSPNNDFAQLPSFITETFKHRKESQYSELIFHKWLAVKSVPIIYGIGVGIIIVSILAVIFWPQSPVTVNHVKQISTANEGTSILVTEFKNRTDQADLGLNIRESIIADLTQPELVRVVERAEIENALWRMRRPDSTVITRKIGLEIGSRDGYPIVISGVVSSIGSTYQVSIQIIETATRKVVVHLREPAETKDDIIKATGQLSQRLREELLQSLDNIQQITPLPKLITPSLEALRLRAEAGDYFGQGDFNKAIILAKQAAELDTAFASAYGLLSAAHNNIGSHEKSDHYRRLTNRYANTLSGHQSIEALANDHFKHDQMDSAAYYYELLQEIEPDRSTFQLGEVYMIMGQLEKALQMYRHDLQESPTRIVPHIALIHTARKLGREELADSVMVLMKDRFPGSKSVYINKVANALRFRHLDLADSLATVMVDHSNREIRAWGRFHKLFLSAMHGKLKHTLAQADSLSVDAYRNVGPAGISCYLRMSIAAAFAAKSTDRALPALRAAEPYLWGRENSWGVADLEVLASGYALAGMIGEAERVLIHIDSLRKANDIHSTYGPNVRAVIALQKGRPKEAINHLRTFRSQRYGKFDPLNMWIWAEAHNRLEMPEKAIEGYRNILYSARLGMWYWSFYRGPLWTLAHEQLGYAYLATGNTIEAARHLSTFVELWEEADSDLQPRVAEARKVLARL